MIDVRRNLVLLAAVAVTVMSSSCRTLADYGRVYDDADGEPGVESLPVLRDRQQRAHDDRVAVWGPAKAAEIARCEVLRGQLVHAARAAQGQLWFVWGCPCVWPVDALSACVYPIQQTQTATQVLDAAHALEQAYQTDTDTFLRACALVQKSDVGRAFAPVAAPRVTASTEPASTEPASTEPASTEP